MLRNVFFFHSSFLEVGRIFFFFFFSLKTYVSYQPWEIFLYYFADHFLFILFFCKCYWLDMNHLTLFPSPHLGEELIMQICFLIFPLEKLFRNSSFFFSQSSFFLWYSFVRTIFEFMGAKSFDTSSLAFVKATFFPLIYLCVPCGRFSFFCLSLFKIFPLYWRLSSCLSSCLHSGWLYVKK